MIWTVVSLVALAVWSAVLLVPWRPWSTAETLEARVSTTTSDLSGVTVVIPARNEDAVVLTTLRSVSAQGRGLSIVLVDDQSTDDTRQLAESSGIEGLTVIQGQPLPEGWVGKVWALEQGRRFVRTPLVLLLDADIELFPGTLPTMVEFMRVRGVQLLSLMARLRMESFWERMLMPAFVYYFKLLYPFRLSNSSFRGVAAAAGGCVLLQTRALNSIGGFAALRDAVIDDCELARKVKECGFRSWTGLTRSAVSQREYPNLRSVWETVSRSAFTQLRYSSLLLVTLSMLFLVIYLGPVAGIVTGDAPSVVPGIMALLAMMLGYLPTLRYYERSPAWALGLPLIGLLYLGMTWSSAWHYWRGTRARWKERTIERA